MVRKLKLTSNFVEKLIISQVANLWLHLKQNLRTNLEGFCTAIPKIDSKWIGADISEFWYREEWIQTIES